MRRAAVFVFSFLILALLPARSSAGSPALAPHAPLPQPTNISCQGRERDTVAVYWKDTATDENNYRVERSINNGAWSQVATISPDSNGNYPGYFDTAIDVTQNRRYRVRSYRTNDDSYSPYSSVCNNRRIYDPGAFRVFYGLRGTTDDCPMIDGQQVCLADVNTGSVNTYVNVVNSALGGSVAAFNRVGFDRPADAPPGSLDKIPINVVWCDGGGCAGGGGLGLSPLLLEMPFDLVARTGDPIAWIVNLHEAFHFQQFKYWGLNDPADGWVVEGQARSIQDKFCIGSNRATANCFDDIATGYAGYVPQVMGYLGNPNWPINQYSYTAALFWTYVVEKYGTSPASDATEGGMNLMVNFWKDSATTPGRDGIAVLNSVLSSMGYSQRFRDIWKDFAVASYAKDLSGPGVPATYKYADMAEPGGTYGPVALSLNQNLGLGASYVDADESVYQWAAKYYQVRPASNVPVIDIKFTQDSSFPLYYTVLGIKGTDLAYEYNVEARHLDHTLVNDNYDRVVVIVAGLDSLANYRVAFNGTQPSLQILSPTTANKARVGSPSAPDKFLVTLQVLAGDGAPLAGVNLANFSFRVGAMDVPAGNILTSAKVMGQEWFVLRAPAQAGVGQYDLQVKYSTILTGTQPLAVDYTPRNDADNMLLVDRSGSMGGAGKMDAAKDTARLFIDSWRTGDKIGVVSFNHTPTLEMGLTDWSDSPGGGSRQRAFDKINALTATGGTNIGDSLRMGWDQLTNNGNTSHDWALVLLSDGKEEASTPNETFEAMINNLKNAAGKRPVVHAVAIGPDADRLRMQRIATATGGTYQYVSTPSALYTIDGVAAVADLQLNLDYRFRMIATNILGQQQFYTQVGPIQDDDAYQDVLNINVESGAAEMVMSLSWVESACCIGKVSLMDPNNQAVSPFEIDTRHIIWRVPTPMGGTWTLAISTIIITRQEGGQAELAPQAEFLPTAEFLPPYLVQAALRSDVTLDAYLTTPLEERLPGVPMGILASLTDTGPITGAWVLANIDTPLGNALFLWLWDDGAHGDGAANDGLYGNTLYQTGQPGSYNVTVNALGTSSLAGGFSRQAVLSFHLDSQGDRDLDGLPDEWEIRFGTDPDQPDAGQDPDNDGADNASEWERGTDPLDPDSDDGGEGDGTDQDPLDPANDGIEPTWAVAYPGIHKVLLKYAVRPEYVVMGIFRGGHMDGPFTFYDEDFSVDGVFTDTVVTNGEQYCYFVLGQDSEGRQSARLTPTCATPNADPFAPHGSILINDGAPSTLVPDVGLTLWASDEVFVEAEMPSSALLLPPADSASGVTEMIIGNYADLQDGVWEAYAASKPWTLAQSSGLAAVYVKYRDAYGNESAVYPATIYVGSGPGMRLLYLPIIPESYSAPQ